MKCGDEFSCRIEKIVYGGKGLARVDGVVVFVMGVAPGETVRVKVSRMRKNYAEAELQSVEIPSPLRIENDCMVGGRPVPGCVYAHLTPELELKVKQDQFEDFISRIFPSADCFLPPENSPSHLHYRNKITLHFQDGRLGYRMEASHTTLDTPQCPLAGEGVNRLLSRFRASPAFAALRDGDNVVFRVDATGATSVIRVPRRGRKSFWNEGGGEFVERAELELRENSPSGELRVAESGFYQINGSVGHSLAATVADWYAQHAASTPEVMDLYCGVGVFALACAARGASRVVGVESCGAAVEMARKNAEDHSVRARFIRASLVGGGAIHAKWVGNAAATAVVIDPPRGGADPGCIESVNKFGFPRVFYVSCDPATLARDAKELAKGGYRPVRSKLFNMFPRTARFESVTEFVREAKNAVKE